MKKIMVLSALFVSTITVPADSGRCHIARLFGLITQQERVIKDIEATQKKNVQMVKDVQKKITKLSLQQYRQAYKCEKIAACQNDQLDRQDYLENELLPAVEATIVSLHEQINSLEGELRQSYSQDEREKRQYKGYVEKRFDVLAVALDELGQDSEDKIMAIEQRLVDLERHVYIRNHNSLFSPKPSSDESSAFENLSLSAASTDEDSFMHAQINHQVYSDGQLEP